MLKSSSHIADQFVIFLKTSEQCLYGLRSLLMLFLSLFHGLPLHFRSRSLYTLCIDYCYRYGKLYIYQHYFSFAISLVN